jgi:hypothetical protein
MKHYFLFTYKYVRFDITSEWNPYMGIADVSCVRDKYRW